MKKIILPTLFGVMLLASCKKDYTCECTSTSTTTGSATNKTTGTTTPLNSVSTSTSSDKYTKITKKQMAREEGCISSEYSYNDSYSDAFYEYDKKTTVTEDCKINK